MNVFIRLLLNSLAVYITARILPGVSISSFLTAVVVTIILGFANTFIKPVFVLLTLPLNFITLGLFTFVINAFMIILADMVIAGFDVKNFGWALIFSLLLSLVSSILFSLASS